MFLVLGCQRQYDCTEVKNTVCAINDNLQSLKLCLQVDVQSEGRVILLLYL